jgi:archaeosortase A (PGF-CTERM-specific)
MGGGNAGLGTTPRVAGRFSTGRPVARTVSLFRPVSTVDLLFLLAVVLLLVSTVLYWNDRRRVARLAGLSGWALFAVFWAHTAVAYLLDARYFLGSIGLVTVVVTAYAGLLVHRRRPEGVQLTVAFSVMGLLFVPYEWVDPVHRTAIQAVAESTAWGLSILGLDPILLTGPEGYRNVVAFRGIPLSHSIGIVSACSGISAVALFVGLIAATDAPLRRRLAASVGIAALIYVLNLVRTVFVAGALGGGWFGFAAAPIGVLYGVSDPGLASYYLAEYLVSQILVVLVLLLVYRRFSRYLPELQDLVGGVTEAFLADLDRVRQR